MKRILLVIKSDGIGGVERHVSRILDTCRRRAIECEVVALSPSAMPGSVLADRGVRVLASPFSRGPLRRVHQLLQLRSLLRRRPWDGVLAFGPSPNALVCLARPRGVFTVISEHGNPFVAHRRWWNLTMMWSYRRADALILQTRQVADDLRVHRAIPREVIVRPVMLGAEVPLADLSAPRSLTVVTVGRLVPSKRVADLIAAFASLAPRFPGWALTIVGDGRERRLLEEQAEALGIASRVHFTGFVQEPWKSVAAASIFVLCSAHEGFPNVLMEAAASGCALVSSDCRYGPREILDDGKLGLLYPVGDVARLTECLARLMGDAVLRLELARRAHASVERYRPVSGDDPWLEPLAALASRRSPM